MFQDLVKLVKGTGNKELQNLMWTPFHWIFSGIFQFRFLGPFLLKINLTLMFQLGKTTLVHRSFRQY